MTQSLSPPVQALLNSTPTLGDWFEPGPNGTLIVKTGRVELGQGNLTALLQIAAQTLDLPADQLSILAAETGRSPDEGVTAGSMSISVGGMALRHAARALKTCLDAAPSLPEALSDLDWSQPIDQLQPSSASESNARQPIPRIDLHSRMIGAPFLHDIELPGMLYGAPLHLPPGIDAEGLNLSALARRDGVVAVHHDQGFIGILAKTEWQAHRAAKWALAKTGQAPTHEPTTEPFAALAAESGNLETSFEKGALIDATNWSHESRIFRPNLSHGSIGPSAAVALWEGDRLQVWTHSQGIYPLRRAISQALKLEVDQITIRHAPGAGCYGHNGADDAAFDATLMAREVPGRPVKVVWSRRDEFTASPVSAAMIVRARASLTSDGRIGAMETDVVSSPHSTRPGTAGSPHLRAAPLIKDGTLPGPVGDIPMARGGGADRNAAPGYDIGNIRVRKHIVQDIGRRTSALRSLGAHANVYAVETLMDQLAASLDEDPIAFRLRHLSDPRALAVLTRAADLAAPHRQAEQSENAAWGSGYARYKGTSGYCAVVVRAEIDEELAVTDVFAAADIGEIISPDGARNQIEGGILQSISWTTKEEVNTSAPAEGWLDYPILRFSEVPNLKIDLIDRPDVPPLGCGELAQGPVAAAIGNAIFSFFGKSPEMLPITREKLVHLLVGDTS